MSGAHVSMAKVCVHEINNVAINNGYSIYA